MRRFAFGAVILLVLIAIGYSYFGDRVNKQTALNPTPDPVNVPSDWEKYLDEAHKYEISFPKDFEVLSNGDDSNQIVKEKTEMGPGYASFIYISVVPKDEDVEDGTIYNFNQKFFNILNGMKVNETKSVVEGEQGLDEWYKYTRVNDVVTSGEKTKVFKNEKPWEFPQGTVEFFSFFEKGDSLYIVGAYLNPNGINKELFDNISSTLRVSP